MSPEAIRAETRYYEIVGGRALAAAQDYHKQLAEAQNATRQFEQEFNRRRSNKASVLFDRSQACFIFWYEKPSSKRWKRLGTLTGKPGSQIRWAPKRNTKGARKLALEVDAIQNLYPNPRDTAKACWIGDGSGTIGWARWSVSYTYLAIGDIMRHVLIAHTCIPGIPLDDCREVDFAQLERWDEESREARDAELAAIKARREARKALKEASHAPA